MTDKEAVLKKASGYMEIKTLLGAAEVDVFTALEEAPCDVSRLAQRLGTNQSALNRLLDALVAMQYLYKNSEIYTLTDQGSLLSIHHPETVLPMVMHLNDIWENWSNLTESVKKGENPNRYNFTEKAPEQTKNFIGAMDVFSKDLAGDIANSHDSSGFRKLLDIGAGAGTYIKAFLRKNPELEAVYFDLPSVVPLAKAKIRDARLEDRMTFVPGDYYQDELPGGCDLALLSAIIHQNSARENLDLYAKIHRSISRRGAANSGPYHGRDQDPAPSRGYLCPEHAGEHRGRGYLHTAGSPRHSSGGGIQGSEPNSGRQSNGLPGGG